MQRPLTEREPPSIRAGKNPYGYRYNVNHPKIAPLYERFKNWKKVLIPSDAQRFEFEAYMDQYIKKHPEEFEG